ncbi:DM13 domain-containing protein [Ferrimonas sediminicola]|nr:DM13 domain-containing protein [Ferrimonas sediminicola]
MRTALLTLSHLLTLAAGVMLGLYLLPILAQPAPVPEWALQRLRNQAVFRGEFRRGLEGSDLLHWGEGTLYLSPKGITLEGELAPGPTYRLYLSPQFVDTEAGFLDHRHKMVDVGRVARFRNFMLTLPEGIRLEEYTTAIIWCESFGQFISAARYRKGA